MQSGAPQVEYSVATDKWFDDLPIIRASADMMLKARSVGTESNDSTYSRDGKGADDGT